jgi:hypothetical protein
MRDETAHEWGTRGMRAGHQDKMFEGGNAYMDREFPRLDHLIRASIVRDK